MNVCKRVRRRRRQRRRERADVFALMRLIEREEQDR